MGIDEEWLEFLRYIDQKRPLSITTGTAARHIHVLSGWFMDCNNYTNC